MGTDMLKCINYSWRLFFGED
ncbi:hypothetical protein CA2559_05610 [Croceibacter atlanticus HTCC2559]|uniref:Uncharacterized protein n=1 Tax=Croceibacter atlanticus (strain ATCC BAA-628 / JCM 21780 / CIP 108009 / IAM 15332 / KCTC 12090 / HTCC2559) TaxID=216432 RepID=A3U7J4_CROAH|nr:hypothetical protein CA2559_05610 [Croceibacter atlanticus HTCC2559]